MRLLSLLVPRLNQAKLNEHVISRSNLPDSIYCDDFQTAERGKFTVVQSDASLSIYEQQYSAKLTKETKK